jgi:DNA-binding XRE family transcriptional regulator
MKTVTTWKEYKREALKDPELKKAYDALEPEYKLASSLIQARLDNNLTQQQLAEKAGVTQNTITRLESGITNPTVGSINRVAGIFGKELQLVRISR